MKKVFMAMALCLMCAIGFIGCKKEEPTKPENHENVDSVTFKIEISDVKSSSASVSVIPSDSTVAYYFDVLDKASFEEYTSDTALVSDYIASFKETIEEYAVYGYDYTLEDFFSKGEDSYDFTGLTASTDYYAIAFAYDLTNSKLIGTVQKQPFTTTELIPSENVITITVTDGVATITTTNDDPYYFDYESKEEWDEYVPNNTQTEMKEEVVAWVNTYLYYGYTEDEIVYTGSQEIDCNEYLNTETEYVFFAAGYNGGVTTDVVTASYTTPADTTSAASAPAAKTIIRRHLKK